MFRKPKNFELIKSFLEIEGPQKLYFYYQVPTRKDENGEA